MSVHPTSWYIQQLSEAAGQGDAEALTVLTNVAYDALATVVRLHNELGAIAQKYAAALLGEAPASGDFNPAIELVARRAAMGQPEAVEQLKAAAYEAVTLRRRVVELTWRLDALDCEVAKRIVQQVSEKIEPRVDCS